MSRCGARVNSQDHGQSQMHMSKQLNREGQTTIHKLKNKMDMKTTETDCTYEFTRLTQMTVFHNLCRDYHEITAPTLDCAPSGYLHTICSVVTKEKISSLRLRLLSQRCLAKIFTKKGLTALPSHQQHLQLLHPQATPVPPASASLALLQITPVPSGFHAVVEILDILHRVRDRFI